MEEPAVVGIIQQRIAGVDATLLGRKNSQGAPAGELGCPGEKLEPGEDQRVALWRMGMEELGTPVRGIYRLCTAEQERTVVWWLCALDRPEDYGRIHPRGDLVSAGWYPTIVVPVLTGPVNRSRWPAEVRAYFGPWRG